ncbi:hypothetical protein TUM4636_23390 [Shewanella glacialipiscicola]|nr:hypothetical protein TUM4636_23390 [Shewanella glacialipiscicola]
MVSIRVEHLALLTNRNSRLNFIFLNVSTELRYPTLCSVDICEWVDKNVNNVVEHSDFIDNYQIVLSKL